MKHPAISLSTITLLICLFFPVAYSQEQLSSAKLDDTEVEILSSNILFGDPQDRNVALDILVTRGNPDIVATLILSLRYRGARSEIIAALKKLTGKDLPDWNAAMLWQEAHKEIIPHESFRKFKLNVFRSIDPNFMRFLEGERSARSNMKIRLEEITWGGVVVDGIPSLDNPTMISGDAAEYIKDSDLVFGIEINGDARAYPLRIMGWHEMFNETIGGVPVTLAYCTLCGSGILFETHVEGRDKPLVFGSSGFLYRSNKLMFDRETNSLWNQFTGEPVSGPLVNEGIKLKIRPVVITTWERWKASNQKSKILSLKTGHRRNYASGNVYNAYFASPDLMFPVIVKDESQLKRKEYVFGIRDVGVSKAWPITAFSDVHVINDAIGDRNLVLIGDAATRSVRAYERGEREFAVGDSEEQVKDGETIWQISEASLTNEVGKTLPRVAGHIAYWFAWDGYLGVESDLYGE